MTNQNHKLPDGWQEVELGEIVKNEKFAVVDGPFGTQLHASEYVPVGIPVVRIKNITRNNQFDPSDLVYITEGKFSQLIRSPVYPRDILLAKTGATIGKVCLLPHSIQKALIASSCAKISIDLEKADPIYIKIFLSTQRGQDQIIALSGGSTRSSINLTPLKTLKIPLPPLPTQKTIVQILEKAEHAKRNREDADKLTNEYLKSVFNEMFYNKGFEEVELEKVCLQITDGIHNTPKLENSGIPMLDSKDIDNNFNINNTNSIKFISRETDLELSKRCKPQEEDILVSSRGSIGKIAIIKKNQNFNIMGNIILIRSNKLRLNFRFLANYLHLFNNQLAEKSRGVAQQGLYLSTVRKLKLPLPPLPLQQKFAKIVEHVEKIKEKQQKSKEKLDEMFNVLMQKAFKGELVR